MITYQNYSQKKLREVKQEVDKKYSEFKEKKLNLNMARGKPCKEQLELADRLYIKPDSFITENNIDCRNYGNVEGLPSARKLFSKLMEVDIKEVIVSGNSSLNLMFDSISHAFNHGLYGFEKPWSDVDKVKFICPSPGYDRHFAVCEFFDIEMIPVPYLEDGPDMDMIEELVSVDESIKGIWCVPKYSNPTGIVYSDEVVERLASLKSKAEDFRIFWDNAYIVHHLTDNPPKLKNIITTCKEYGHPDRVITFASTSKITYAGAGLGIMAASSNNIKHLTEIMSKQTIGSNKINQLQHVKFFDGSLDKILEHMKKHAEILKPKFEIVLDILEKRLGDKNIAQWNNPQGGYFISLNVQEGCAQRVVNLANKAGVTLTPAGATYPYKKDPKDSNIRLAPTFPPIEELKKAIEIVCTCVEKAALEKMLENE